MFKTHVPIAPGPRGRPDPNRENDTIHALGETRSALSRLISMLSQYSPKFIEDAKGMKYEVLGKDIGRKSKAKELATPWKIYLKNFQAGWKFGVEYHSDVYDGVSWTTIPVSGLLTDPADENDAGWKFPKKGFVFLWGTMKADGATVDKIEVKNDQESLEFIKRVDSEDGKQTQFAYVLGYLWSEGAGGNIQWYVRQEAWRHVTLLYVNVNGVLCKVPFEM